MNELQVFNYNDKAVRTVENDGTIWWVLKDVCDVLGIGNPSDVNSRLDDDEKGVDLIDTLGGKQKLNTINESGLYNVILRSDKPEAKNFKRWVTHEILPSIRKTGTYQVKPSRLNESEAEAKLNNSRARVSALWMKLADRVSIPEYSQICACYASKALAGYEVIPLPVAQEHYYSATEIGAMLGVTSQRIGKIANQNELKTQEYGKLFFDKSPYSPKEVEVFRYNGKGVERLKEILGS